jgi:SAM-dependent methyltransferase
LVAEDIRITDAHYGLTLELWKCDRCGFIFAPEANSQELVDLYGKLDDAEYVNGLESRCLQFRRLLDKVLCLFPSSQSMLDVGAGMGLLVREGQAKGLKAVGVEPSRWLVEAGRSHFGLDILQGILPHPNLTNQTFDLVFLVDVLEHVADPLALLSHCRRALSPNGALIVIAPDVHSMAARILGKKWWHFRLAHVGYFDRKTLISAATRSGFRPFRFMRASWYFEIGYLAERLARYLPIRWWNRLAVRFSPIRWLYKRTIPLNLFDSWVGVFVPTSEDFHP